MKKFIIVFVVVLFFNMPSVCSAEEVDVNDIYNEQLEALDLEKLNDNLSSNTKDILEKIDLSDPATSFSDAFTPDNVFDIINDFLKNNVKTPIKSGLTISSVLLFAAACGSVYEHNKLIKYTVAVCLAASAVLPAVATVTVCADTLKNAGFFMLSFLPIFAAVLASSGKPLTAAGFSAVMTVATQFVTAVCSFLLVPLSGMQLSLGLCGCVSGDFKLQSVTGAVKKISNWSLSLITTVFLAVLGIQTAINSPADNLYSKTAKFLLGSAVPYVGNVVSEALNTVRGCVSLLRSTVMIYGVCAVALTVLPVIIELVVWRLVFWVCGSVAEVLSVESAVDLIKSVDTAMSFVLGITLLVLIMFIISLTLVTVI